MKNFFIDLETTGTDPEKNGIIQISGIIEINGKVAGQIDFRPRPFPQDVIEDHALEVNGITREQLTGYEPAEKIYHKFISILNNYVDQYDRRDKFHFIGYNSKFDDGFLRSWFRKLGNNYYGSYFFWPAIDVANIAAVEFMKTRSSFPNFKLMTVAAASGLSIEHEKLHDAMYDIKITRELFYKLNPKASEVN